MQIRLLALSLLMPIAAACAYAQPSALALGSMLPEREHRLQHMDGTDVPVSSLLGASGTVFIFWSNACRWTRGYHERVLKLHAEAREQGVAIVLVNSNDSAAFPEESPKSSAAKRYPLPYVHDAGAVLAKALGAHRTPEVFAFDRAGKLAYFGAIDDAPSDVKAVQHTFLADFLQGKPPVPTKAFGCRIRFPGS